MRTLLLIPENQVSSFVGFPCLYQGIVSSNGFFHDIIRSIEVPTLSWCALLYNLAARTIANRRTT